MPNWRKTIRIKHLLSDDDSAENAREAAGKVAVILKRQREYNHSEHEEFTDIACSFADLGESSDGTCSDFNDLLAWLYDWADSERVWIGGERGVLL